MLEPFISEDSNLLFRYPLDPEKCKSIMLSLLDNEIIQQGLKKKTKYYETLISSLNLVFPDEKEGILSELNNDIENLNSLSFAFWNKIIEFLKFHMIDEIYEIVFPLKYDFDSFNVIIRLKPFQVNIEKTILKLKLNKLNKIEDKNLLVNEEIQKTMDILNKLESEVDGVDLELEINTLKDVSKNTFLKEWDEKATDPKIFLEKFESIKKEGSIPCLDIAGYALLKYYHFKDNIFSDNITYHLDNIESNIGSYNISDQSVGLDFIENPNNISYVDLEISKSEISFSSHTHPGFQKIDIPSIIEYFFSFFNRIIEENSDSE